MSTITLSITICMVLSFINLIRTVKKRCCRGGSWIWWIAVVSVWSGGICGRVVMFSPGNLVLKRLERHLGLLLCSCVLMILTTLTEDWHRIWDEIEISLFLNRKFEILRSRQWTLSGTNQRRRTSDTKNWTCSNHKQLSWMVALWSAHYEQSFAVSLAAVRCLCTVWA